LGHALCGSFGWWQWGHSTTEIADNFQWVLLLFRLALDVFRLGLAIVSISLLSQFLFSSVCFYLQHFRPTPGLAAFI